MKKISFSLILIMMLCAISPLVANDGDKLHSLSGKILDVATGEALAGALITVAGTDIKVYSDLDGNFIVENINVELQEINVSLVTYKTLKLKNFKSLTSSEDIEIGLYPIL